MEAWRKVFRDGVIPLLTLKHLKALREAMVKDDSRLLQGGTTTPPPFQSVWDWPVEQACLLGYPGVIEHGGFGVATVAETEVYFAKMCFEIDRIIGEPAGVRHLLNHFDATLRNEMLRDFLPEIERAIALKKEAEPICVEQPEYGGES